MEMYTECFSRAFDNLTFSEASELCFLKLKLLLIAIEIPDMDPDNTTGSNILINPRENHRITRRTQGFFMAQSAEDAKRAYWYCRVCHAKIADEKDIKKCKCKPSM